jgi:4,5-dihydroxyphthalate decarboxylase
LTWLNETQTFDVMLDRGELDAAYGFAPRHDRKLQKYNIDRYGGTPIEGNPRFKKLFADAGREVIREFHEKTRCVPANHTVAVQTRLLEENPWLAAELFELFSASKRLAYQANGRRSPGYLYFDGDDPVSQAEIFGDDPFPFGINKNRPMLDMLFRFSHQGGLTRKLAKAEEVFFPALLDT